jgi:hypothetical protein
MIAMTDDLIIDNDGCEFDIYLRVADGPRPDLPEQREFANSQAEATQG